MGILRRKRQSQPDQSDPAPAAPEPSDHAPAHPVGYNPQRDEYLYWRTEEGYIIAQDVNCQHEYIEATPCPQCGGELTVVAHINRAGQGLSELVALCRDCRQRANFIFDISNGVFQTWWASQLGPLYIKQYDGPPRQPHTPD